MSRAAPAGYLAFGFDVHQHIVAATEVLNQREAGSAITIEE
jgi:hypothetical protein